MIHRAMHAATLIFLFAAISLALALSGKPAAAAPLAQTKSTRRPLEYRADAAEHLLIIQAPHRAPSAHAAVNTSMLVNFLAAGTYNSFGDACQAWPAAAKTAFTAAADVWAASLSFSVPLKTNACWTSLGANILGHSGAVDYSVYQSGSVPGFWYPDGLANELARTDLNDHDKADWDGDGLDADAEIDVALSSNFGWYTGTDGLVPSGKYDMESVVLHELGHGLGFLGWMNDSGGQGSWGYGSSFAGIFDRYTRDQSGQSLINIGIFQNPSVALGSQLTGGNLYFDGAHTRAANGGNPARLYAPSIWNPGSSYSHLDEIYNGSPNALMTYSLSTREAIHDPGPIMLGVLQDLGWTLPAAAPAQCYTLTINANPSVAGSVAVSTTPNCSGGYLDGTSLTLTATPGSGYKFSGWVGCTGAAVPSTQLTVDGNENVTAIFTSAAGSGTSQVFLPVVVR